MMQKNIFICIFLCLCSYGFGQFAADFSISNDPNVIGILTGDIYYDQTTTNMRLEYTLGVIELFNFTAQIRYLGCPTGLGTYSCDAETYKVPFPRFYVEGGDSPVSGQNYSPSAGRTCSRYNKGSQPAKGVSAIWVDGSGYPCRALFVGTTKQIDFNNIRAVGAPAYTQYRSWGCPQQQCDRMMDFILVFDESGSIDSTSFNQEKSFARGLAQSYTFGSYGVAMGLIMFSGTARRIIYPSVDQQSTINAINGVVQNRGSTCIPCGIDIARSDFATRGRAGATKIMIVLTDGENNVRDSDFYSVTTAAHNEGILCFAVGVAGYNLGQLNVIASSISGVTTVFTTPDWSQLQGLLLQLVSQTCIDIPGNPCGAGCNGFCSCNSVCLCPDTCNDSNACTQDLCTANANGNGCRYVPITCNDNDACTNDICDINTGCGVGSQVNCDDGNPCTIDTCNKATGCSYLPRDCNDNNPCTQDLCSAGQGGCYHPPQSCNRCIYPVNVTCPKINCFTNECDPGTGNCTATAKVCNDGNACTNDLCNPLTGNCTTTAVVCNDNNACTHDFCDPITGCYTTPFDVPNECNDYSACTTDTCNPSTGCVHTPINCNDGDNCTSDTCNSALGCQFPVRVCANELNVGQCSVATCSQDRGCYLEPVPSLTLDCGLCALSGETCQDQDLDTKDIIGISSGVAAAIGLAVVAVVAVISGFSGKKLYDIYVKNKGNLQGAQMSPLYQDNGLSGTNPLFEHPQ